MYLPDFSKAPSFLKLLDDMGIPHSSQASTVYLISSSEEQTPIHDTALLADQSPLVSEQSVKRDMLDTILNLFKSKTKLKLDFSKINQLSQESKNLAAMVNQVINVQEEPIEEAPNYLKHSSLFGNLRMFFPDNLEKLDNKYYAVLKLLVEQHYWEKREYQSLVRQFNLMPEAVIEVINSWSDEFLGDYLIELFGDIYKINLHLCKMDQTLVGV